MRQVEDFDNRREEPQSQTAHTDPPRYRLLEWFLCAQFASVSRRTIPKRALIQFGALRAAAEGPVPLFQLRRDGALIRCCTSSLGLSHLLSGDCAHKRPGWQCDVAASNCSRDAPYRCCTSPWDFAQFPTDGCADRVPVQGV